MSRSPSESSLSGRFSIFDRRAAIFLALSGMYLVAYFYRVSAAVIADDLRRDLGLSAPELGTMSAALFYAFAITQLPLGPLLDRVGARRVISAFGLVTACGALLFATADGFGSALAGRALIGAGTACVLMGSLKIYSVWFPPHYFATLAGIQVALGNLGNLLATAPLAWLSGVIGWRTVFLLLALVSVLAAVAVMVIVRDAPGREKTAVSDSPARDWAQAASSPQFWRISLLAFFWYGTYMSVQGLWGGPYLSGVHGLGREQTGGLLLLTAIGFILGCPVAGRLADRSRLSRRRVVTAGQLGLLLLVGLFLGPLEKAPLWMLGGVFLLFGLCVSTGPVLYSQVKEIFPGEMAATAMTGVNFFVVAGAAVVQQLMGWVLSGAPGDPMAFRVAYAVPAVGLAVAWLWYLRGRYAEA